jgi:hypothetical protein
LPASSSVETLSLEDGSGITGFGRTDEGTGATIVV